MELCLHSPISLHGTVLNFTIFFFAEVCCIIAVQVKSWCFRTKNFAFVDSNFYTEELITEMIFGVLGKYKGGYELFTKHNLCPFLWDGDAHNFIK
jgi:hypothetical protein